MGVSARDRRRFDRFAMRSQWGRFSVFDGWLGLRCFAALLAFGLEFAKFGGAFVQQAVGLGTGAVDRVLDSEGTAFIGLHGVHDEDGVVVETEQETGFHLAAAAETPCGAADFFDESVFESPDGSEFAFEIGLEFDVVGLFVGADEVASGEEAEGDAVTRGGCFALFGAGACGGLRVALVGCDLSCCGHFVAFPFGELIWLPDFRKARGQVGFC